MTKKPYRLTLTEHQGYLKAEIQGETVSAEIIRQYVGEIAARSNETGKDRILLYRDIPMVLPTGEMFFGVNESMTVLARKKIALVNPHRPIDTVVDLAVTIARNRGANYKNFDNVADAEAWLLGDEIS